MKYMILNLIKVGKHLTKPRTTLSWKRNLEKNKSNVRRGKEIHNNLHLRNLKYEPTPEPCCPSMALILPAHR